ncbi:MAG: hypothetical protein Rubg2KO_08390 [Rubricoccaceae bacterium]
MRLVSVLTLCVLTSSLATAQSDLSTASPFDKAAYNAGHNAAGRFLTQYSSGFSYDLFTQGFQAGLAGDSAQIAFSLGLRAGLELKADTLSGINADLFLRGVQEGLNGTASPLTPQEIEQAFAVVQDSLQRRQKRAQEATEMAQLREQAATDPTAADRLASIRTNKVAADSFLAVVRLRDGIQETESGVLYTINTPGQGASPTPQSEVTIEYVGQFMNGEVFDQSPPGETATHPVRIFIDGFRASILDMKPGESRTIYIPPHLAYGVLGAAGGIPPNSALVFDITLVSFTDTPAAPPPPAPRN